MSQASPGGPDPGASGREFTRPQRFSHMAMACRFEFFLYGIAPDRARGVAHVAFAEIERLEQLLSRFIEYSDIARLNATALGTSVQVSPETVECLQIAARWYTATGGAFDVAFRSRRRWSELAGGSALPDQPEPQQQAGGVLTPLAFDPASHAIRVLLPGLDLDLGGIGKGYALDRAAEILREYGVPAGLLHSGESTIRVFSDPPRGRPWRLNLRHPEQHGPPPASVEVQNEALSGSGQLPHDRHIIDPQTGRPVETRAAWAVAPTAADADALSTAFMLMPPAAVAALCGRCAGVSAIFPASGAGELELRSFGPHRVSVHGRPGA
ncbi:MAG: FAD:protein FMN transferase [Planctomycetota bacterium]